MHVSPRSPMDLSFILRHDAPSSTSETRSASSQPPSSSSFKPITPPESPVTSPTSYSFDFRFPLDKFSPLSTPVKALYGPIGPYPTVTDDSICPTVDDSTTMSSDRSTSPSAISDCSMDRASTCTDLSSLASRSPSPSKFLQTAQHSGGTTTPRSESFCSGASDNEERPAKKRRVHSSGPRETKRLDLYELEDSPAEEQQVELERLMKGLRNKKKIVVVAGAGISVSAGIPDFRSSGGLFKALKAEHKLKGSGKSLFDADVYRDSNSTSTFHTMVRNLSKSTKSAQATPFHQMLARLAAEKRLLRLYTQNVDGIDTALEPLSTAVPLDRKGPWPTTIQLHGGLDKMVCTKCGALDDFDADLFDGPIPPECVKCTEIDRMRTEVAGKRSHGIGRMRPRMVLYNEPGPDDEAIGSVAKADMRRRPDAIIVVGTSMKIPGVRRIVKEMCKIVRDHRDGLSVWINNDPEPSGVEFKDAWDIIVRGTSDDIAKKAALGRWEDYKPDQPETIEESSQSEVDEAKKKSGQPVILLDNTLGTTHGQDAPVLSLEEGFSVSSSLPNEGSESKHNALPASSSKTQVGSPAKKAPILKTTNSNAKPSAKAGIKRKRAPTAGPKGKAPKDSVPKAQQLKLKLSITKGNGKENRPPKDAKPASFKQANAISKQLTTA